MIKKDAFQNLKCRRIYLFFLDEETGEITDITSRDDVIQVVRCKDCKHWLPHTQFGYDADYEEYHNYCKRHLPDDEFYAFIKEADDFCSWAERKEE